MARRFLGGSSTGTVIMALSLGSLLLFTAAHVSTTHLQLCTRLESGALARNLAESTLAEALQQVVNNENFGKANEQVLGDVSDYPAGSLGLVSFTSSPLVPTSKNNLSSSSNTAGALGVIPRNTVHMVALGRVGPQRHLVEMLYYRPPFPKALMASGPIKVTNSLRVTGIDPNVPFPGTSPPVSIPRPASLASNSADNPAMELGPQSYVSGDVGAVGTIRLDPTARVQGEVRQGTDAQPIPPLDINDLINRASGASGTSRVSGTLSTLRVDWYTGSDSSLTITGDLELVEGGVLWVKQDLDIQGCIKGQGLILCGGEVRVGQGASLSAQNLVAIAAQGDVRLRAADRSYYFQGLVYSKGNLNARDITVLGAVVVNGPSGQGRMDLENVDLVEAPVTATQRFGVPTRVIDNSNNRPTDVWIRCDPVVNSDPADPLYNVVILDNERTPNQPFHFRNYNRTMISDLARELMDAPTDSDGRELRITHNQSSSQTLQSMVGQLGNNPGIVLNLNLSSVMAPEDQSRVLLWRGL